MLAQVRQANAPEILGPDPALLPPRPPLRQSLRARRRLRALAERKAIGVARRAEAPQKYAQGWAVQQRRQGQAEAQRTAAIEAARAGQRSERWLAVVCLLIVAALAYVAAGMVRAMPAPVEVPMGEMRRMG